MQKTIYPKTIRLNNQKSIITEKLDGSNLWLFKINWNLIIAQRHNVFTYNELTKNNSYKGLIEWINENEKDLNIIEWSWVFWEWIWMGHISYWEYLGKKFYIFAKANIDEKFNITNLNYDRDLFIHSFENKIIPDYIWIVPLVDYNWPIDIDDMNIQYDRYCENVWREVEGFIINQNNYISKYVRNKAWKNIPHTYYWK